MVIKFDRVQISSVNNMQSVRLNKNKDMSNDKKVAVPAKETFEYILESAKKGNEMAAVQLDEWQRCCKPQNAKEKQVISLINKATKEIFD
ncbi:MAG: hypothetical protein ACM3TR_02885 [Caulobacteraceae bacterium]